MEKEGVVGFAGKEGGGFGLGPVFVAGAVEGGEGIAAGSAGLVIEPGGFVAGRNDHAERSTVTRARDARHATVAGLVDGGEGQGVGDKAGERAGQGMVKSSRLAAPHVACASGM